MTIKNQQTTYVTDTHSEGERTVMAEKPNGNTYEMSQKSSFQSSLLLLLQQRLVPALLLLGLLIVTTLVFLFNERVDTLEEVVVPRTEFSRFDSDITNRLDRIEAKLDRLSER